MALLEVQKLSKHFGGLTAVANNNFVVNQGEILGLIGPNGAGKTTIFNLISGFLRPDQGTIVYKGKEIQGLTPHEISRRGLMRTFQTAQAFPYMTTLQNVMVGGFMHDRNRKRVEKSALETLEFTGLVEQKEKKAENLTIGDSRRLEIAKALAGRPSLLLLDEVMAGLNETEIAEAVELIKKIRDRGTTIFIVEHVMQAIMSLSDRIIVINYGRQIAEGSPEKVAKDNRVIEAYLGEEYVIE
ncbi:MAG: ABC transporter ATP-binding protein [Deltaproteobacteria bacterium]|nr:ABC transporter ATP-binding protein [Deltaproteobacteria bacterium]MBW2301478.1 ABC transporter ATP-binding protein [Deltaproteobacteria bacterium]